jgi:hypothetical protein
MDTKNNYSVQNSGIDLISVDGDVPLSYVGAYGCPNRKHILGQLPPP